MALAICVAVAVPMLGIREQGCIGYLRHYLSPTVVMLPLHIVSEFSRTLALAVRLFGNVMSGGMIVGILLAIVPLFFPVAMQVLGLLTGIIQAYIFAILATVYIGAAARSVMRSTKEPPPTSRDSKGVVSMENATVVGVVSIAAAAGCMGHRRAGPGARRRHRGRTRAHRHRSAAG